VERATIWWDLRIGLQNLIRLDACVEPPSPSGEGHNMEGFALSRRLVCIYFIMDIIDKKFVIFMSVGEQNMKI
jgi:hypothetical protein